MYVYICPQKMTVWFHSPEWRHAPFHGKWGIGILTVDRSQILAALGKETR